MENRVRVIVKTRKIARQIAKNEMHKIGLTRICAKGARSQSNTKREPSYFSRHWRERRYQVG